MNQDMLCKDSLPGGLYALILAKTRKILPYVTAGVLFLMGYRLVAIQLNYRQFRKETPLADNTRIAEDRLFPADSVRQQSESAGRNRTGIMRFGD